jgi:DNA-binding CsgD family transcriptional regulator
VFVFDEHVSPALACAASIGPRELAIQVGKLYMGSVYHQHDPNIELIQQEETKPSVPMIYRLHVDDIADRDYRENIYLANNLLERVSIIDQMDGHWIIVSLYRDNPTGPFSQNDIELITKNAPLLFTLMGKHLAILPPPPWQSGTRPPKEVLEKLVATLSTDLTPREIQVCARAILGMTNNGIGLELGVKTPTVATLRKRAYAKLNISSLNELFALCLANSTITLPDQPISI